MICRRFRPEDKAAVISVLRESIDDWQGDWAEAYWEWKFERNPRGPGRIWVGDDDGRIAGCYIWNPVQVRWGGTTVLGAQSVDAAVHPDYRRRGLFTDLARTAMEDGASRELSFVYAFPVEAAFRGQVRVGFESRLTVSSVHRPLLVGQGGRAGSTVSPSGRPRASTPDSTPSPRAGDSELTVARDAGYLQWRFCEHPTRSYETLVCEREGEIRGYCVVSVDATRRLTRGYVVDLQVLPDSDPAAAFLVYHALRACAHEVRAWPFPGCARRGRSNEGWPRSASRPATSRSSAG